MRILFTGRKAHLTPEIRSFAESKLARLERVLDDVLDAHVILKREKHRHVAEIVVKARTTTLTAEAVGTEFLDSIGPCVDRLIAQARKHTGRLKTRRQGRGAWQGRRRRVAEPGPEAPADEDAPGLVRMGRVAIRAMSLREALLRAQENGPIVVFRDAASKEVGVIFQRPDGRFGLLEMEA